MPRDQNGNYTLPAGNPVVTGNTVTSKWANDTMTDLAAEISNSLSRDGQGGMRTPFSFASGTEVAPGLTFVAETTSGMYLAGTLDVRFAIGAIDRMRLNTDNDRPVSIWNETQQRFEKVATEYDIAALDARITALEP